VATAPNAIAYSTGRMETRDMVWAGLWLDLICVIAIMASVVFIAAPLLGISYEGFPEWAQQP
jgi:di/tricarboxylate transporter